MEKEKVKMAKNTEWNDVEDVYAQPWKDFKKGDSIEGIFMGSEEVRAGPNEKPFMSHHVKKEDGQLVGVSGATLDKRMVRLSKGSKVKVTFDGTQPSKRGTPMKLFKVQVAPGTSVAEY